MAEPALSISKALELSAASVACPNVYVDPAACALSRTLPDVKLEREIVEFARVPAKLLERLRCRPLVLNRQVAAATRETARFLALAEALGRPPLIMTMPSDRFAPSINPWKRRLAKLSVETMHQVRCVRVVDFQAMENLPFAQVRCIDGTPLISFHRELLLLAAGPRAAAAVLDADLFFGREPSVIRYQRFFALFTCFGVLAENYVLEGNERQLVEDAILPAFEATVRRFGRPPAIVRLLPAHSELEPSWDHYPSCVLARALRAAGRPGAARKLEHRC